MSLFLHVGAYSHYRGGIDVDGSGGRRLERLERRLDLLAPLGLDAWFDLAAVL